MAVNKLSFEKKVRKSCSRFLKYDTLTEWSTRFLPCNLDAKSPASFFERLKSRTKSFSSAWGRGMGTGKGSVSEEQSSGCEHFSDDSLSQPSSSLVSCPMSLSSNEGKPFKTGIGTSSECGTGRIAEGMFGYVILCRFFFQTPVVFTMQK